MRRYPSGISKTASTPCVKEIPGPDEHPGDAGVEERVLPDGGGAEDERSHGREEASGEGVPRELGRVQRTLETALSPEEKSLFQPKVDVLLNAPRKLREQKQPSVSPTFSSRL
jgi:hypothetical protein